MIEQMVMETGKGVFRGVGFLIADLLFWRVCYGIGWPVCKVLTLGQYPRRMHRERAIFREYKANTGFACALVGLMMLLFVLMVLFGVLPR